jgi:hypothetical protein
MREAKSATVAGDSDSGATLTAIIEQVAITAGPREAARQLAFRCSPLPATQRLVLERRLSPLMDVATYRRMLTTLDGLGAARRRQRPAGV